MEDARIQTPNIGAAHILTSNLPLDALGPGIAAEGTYPSNDASCESLGILRCLPIKQDTLNRLVYSISRNKTENDPK